ncbi:MAG: coenzyme A pyrophosphatase [Bdellovibrionaceae bacterium]|nr:coenzyme A pyrophosphatase [Pseudobdellovibrionaceae bacterium]|tara:strand:- start:3909 stop:4532 length:624 start_codon:yes stop_codon:yes gene_type:complete
MKIFPKDLENLLSANLSYEPRFPKSWLEGISWRPASVLALFANDQNNTSLLLTQRTSEVETHKGQVSFPGGMVDKTDKDLVQTALRETHEEVGICQTQIEVIGALPVLPIPVSSFEVTPWVSFLKQSPEKTSLNLNVSEIETAFWVPIKDFLDPSVYVRETREGMFQGKKYSFETHVYRVQNQVVWGATAAMIHLILNSLQKDHKKG